MRGVYALILLVAGALVAGCSAEAARWDAPTGRWRMDSTETARSCSAFADVRPFAGGDIAINDHGRALKWHPAVGVAVRYKAIGDRSYKRTVNTTYQGCRISADATLKLDHVDDDRLAGTYHVTYTRRTGSDACRSLPDRCELSFDVTGNAGTAVSQAHR